MTNHKMMKTWQPRLTADEETLVQEALRLLLFTTTEQMKRETDKMGLNWLDQKVGMIELVAKQLGVDVASPE